MTILVGLERDADSVYRYLQTLPGGRAGPPAICWELCISRARAEAALALLVERGLAEPWSPRRSVSKAAAGQQLLLFEVDA